MKPKLTPQEYRERLRCVNLNTIFVKEISSKFNEHPSAEEVKFSINEKSSYVIDEKMFKVYHDCKMSGKAEKSEEIIFKVNASFVITFDLIEETLIDDDFFDIFKMNFITYTTWPFFREIVMSHLSKANLPPLYLPMKKM
jgi:preprotein translocase subunit SecB